ncbi:MAG: hypothetical protein H0W64_11075 [Gammaproteobacteria bacterium]|nr:hypothetical protein [Gammaproteobacteria bacterium]
MQSRNDNQFNPTLKNINHNTVIDLLYAHYVDKEFSPKGLAEVILKNLGYDFERFSEAENIPFSYKDFRKKTIIKISSIVRHFVNHRNITNIKRGLYILESGKPKPDIIPSIDQQDSQEKKRKADKIESAEPNHDDPNNNNVVHKHDAKSTAIKIKPIFVKPDGNQEKLINKINKRFANFQEYLNDINTQSLPDDKLDQLTALQKIAQDASILKPVKLVKSIKRTSKYFLYGPTFPSQSDIYGTYREHVLPESIPLGQYGALSSLPLTVQPASRDDYLFKRSLEYNDKTKRKELLETYYVAMQNAKSLPKDRGYLHAAQFLLAFFAHTVEHYLHIDAPNASQLINFINYELLKLDLPMMDTKKTMVIFRQQLDTLRGNFTASIQNPYLFDSISTSLSPNIDENNNNNSISINLTKMHSVGKEEELYLNTNAISCKPSTDSADGSIHKDHVTALNQANIKILKIKKIEIDSNKNDIKSELDDNALLVKSGPSESPSQISDDAINIYDESGKLIIAYRRNAISKNNLERFRSSVCKMDAEKIKAYGARRADDKGKNNTNIKSDHQGYTSQSAVIGITSAKHARSVCLTKFTHKNKTQETLLPAGQLMSEIEKWYETISPIEYRSVKQQMKKHKAIALPYCDIYTTIDVNFDKQTYLHKDENNFPGFELRALSVVYPNGNKNYKGGYTYFPEYQIAFDLEEGDLLFANFDKTWHCNTELVPNKEIAIDTMLNPNGYSRVSVVGFTKGKTLQRLYRCGFENSDDETDIVVRKPLAGYSFFDNTEFPENMEYYVELAKQKFNKLSKK